MILCCGEALIDMLPRNLPDGTLVYQPVAGGAVFNTATAIGRLGAPSGFFSGLSSDPFGDLLRKALIGSGVDISLAINTDRPSTLAFVTLSGGQARYDFFDENSAGRMLEAGDLPALPDGVEALFFGGISLIGEPCGSTFEALAEREARNRTVFLDPNIRPGFVTDEAAYRARIGRMIGRAQIVKLSDEDLAWLDGKGSEEARARSILDRGPDVVIVTRGEEASSAYTRRRRIDAKSVPVTVVDTIGAGDTFNAGIVTVLHERGVLSRPAIGALGDDDLRAALDFASAAAAATVSRAGADTPWRSELAGYGSKSPGDRDRSRLTPPAFGGGGHRVS